MVSTRGRRRPSSNDLEELGLDGAMKPPPKTAPPSLEDEGSEERDTEAAAEEGENSGDAKHAPAGAAPEPTATPKQAKRPSPSPPPEEEEEEGAGAQGSGVAPPVRRATLHDLAAAVPPPRQKLKTKKTTKRIKRPAPPSQDGVEGSSDTSLARDAPLAPPDPNNRGASSPTPKRAKRPATPPQEEEEQAEKRAAGSDGDGTDLPPAETGVPADKVRHKNKKNKPGKVLAKPLQPDSAELGLAGNRGEVLHAGNTPSLQEKDHTHEEDPQRREMPGQEDADNTSLPQVNGSDHEEEQHMEEDVGQEEQQENSTQEDDDIGIEVSGEADRVASSAKLRSSKGTWSQDDELKILTALVEHSQSHGGALPDSSHLLVNLTFDKADANADKLDDKIRKLRAKYRNRKVRPTDDHGCRLFELSQILWAEVDAAARVDSTVNIRDFNELSELYPYLAKEVKVYAETHSSGDLILAAFGNIGDEKARHLDAMCKKQRFDAFKLELMKANLELSQANLTKEMLSALSSRIN